MAKSKSGTNDTAALGAVASLRQRAAGVDPVVLAAGAAVAGAVAGVFVPRFAGETRLLAPIGRHVSAAAGTLGTAARQALSAELAAVPVVGQIAADQVERVLDAVIEPPAVEPAALEPEGAGQGGKTVRPVFAD